MHRKALQLQVELDIQAITCPGVYLCPNGKISLQLYMLDSCIQTISADPVFPILCHEKFIFYKTFYSAQRLSDLQRLLNMEYFYMELIQWQNYEVGNVLATFQTNLSELLYPTTHEGSMAGVDIDLLMDSAQNFPGVISPKVEVSTKTVIEDTICDGKKYSSFVVNPKVIQSKGSRERNNITHQKKVCHSSGYHRSRKCLKRNGKVMKPPFTYRKVDDDLLSRKPQGLGALQKEICNCRSHFNEASKKCIIKSIDMHPKLSNNKENCCTKIAKCLCKNDHNHENELCPVCSKYKYYFKPTSVRSCNAKERICKSDLTKKTCVLQRPTGITQKKCTCEEISNTGNAKVIRCTSAKANDFSNDVDNRCFCPPKSRESLAEKLHRRLNQALDSCSECPFEDYGNDDYASSAILPKFTRNDLNEGCDCPVVNIGDVYKKIYNTSSKIRCDRYITPCCI